MNLFKYPGFRRGLIGAWCPSVRRFAVSGTHMLDLSRRGNHGTIVASTTTAVENGLVAVDFVSTDDAVDIPNFENWSSPKGTIALWARTDFTTGTRTILGRNRTGNNVGDFAIEISSADDKWSWYYQDGSGTIRSTMAATIDIVTWYHIAVQWGSEHNIWIQGVKQADVQTGHTMAASATSDGLAWGHSSHLHSSTHGTSFNGVSDDLAIWDRELDAGEIMQLYLMGRGAWHRQIEIPEAMFNFETIPYESCFFIAPGWNR